MDRWRIASIKRRSARSNKLVVRFDPEREPLELQAESVTDCRLRAGDLLDGAQIAAAERRDLEIRCRASAWRLLERRPRARAELRRALLQRRFPEEIVDAEVTRLAEAGHLDDAAFARMFADHRAAQGRSGPRLVRQELKARGIGDEDAAEALDRLGTREDQLARAIKLLEKRPRRPGADPQKTRQSAAGHLLRRGFDTDIVWQAVEKVVGRGEE